MKRVIIGIAIILLFLCGIAVGYGVARTTDTHGPSLSVERSGSHNQYRLINPLIDVDLTEQASEGDLLTLKKNISDYAAAHTEDAFQVSVYFRDLNNGPWFGINEDAEFSPASLLKVPLLISILKYADQKDGFLDKKIPYRDINDGVTQDIVPTRKYEVGQEYMIRDLLEAMIVYSDNRAKNTLLVTLSDVNMDEVYNDLGIEVPGIVRREDFMKVRRYATFFRILYNASYLDRENSQWALDLLTRVEYRAGLVAGVPGDVKVAHKFGERVYDGGTKQLHDCGIVYYVKRPYLLCVMTRGYDWGALQRTIAYISSTTYKTISSADRR